MIEIGEYEDTLEDIEKTLGIVPGFMKVFVQEKLVREWPSWKKNSLTEIDLERARYFINIDEIVEEMLDEAPCNEFTPAKPLAVAEATQIAKGLISLGMTKNVAMALTYLQNVNSATSIDLERGTNLRQPEVNIAIKTLKEQDWIIEREKTGKGRQTKVYSLKIKFNDIITQLECQHEKVVDEARANIERLKKFGNIAINPSSSDSK